MATTEQEAQLLALVRSGTRLRAAQRVVGIPLSTAWKIKRRHEGNESEQEIIPTHDQVVAEQAGEIQMGMLDYMAERMEQDPEYAWKNGITINAMRGTAIDKILKRQEVTQPQDAIALLLLERGTTLRYRQTTEYEVTNP